MLLVEEDAKRELFSTQYEPGLPYGVVQVQANLLSDSAATTRKVCIIDSGYDLGHPDLQSSGVTGRFNSGTGNWFTDENGHGTHVAGTIAALANNTGVVGVLPNNKVGLHIVKVFTASGWGYSSSLIAAAGNDGNTRHSYPASYPAVVSVGAVDENEVIAAFSQQTSQVELVGPGVAVLSSVPRGTGERVDLSVAGTVFDANAMEGSAKGSASGELWYWQLCLYWRNEQCLSD